MDSMFFSADPSQADMGDAISHLETHQKLYFEVKFPIRKASFSSFPIAGFVHISGSGDKVENVARIEDIVPFSKDHYEKPELYGDVRPSKWLIEWRDNVNDIQSQPWKYALVITAIDRVDFEMSALRNLKGEPVIHAPQGYYKVMPPHGWTGFGVGSSKAAVEMQETFEDTEEVYSRSTDLAADFAEPPDRVLATAYRILRDTELARRVKILHQFECQICGGTMDLPNGERYAESHHVQPLGQPHNGPDVIGNILCLCPNHHAELDFGVRAILPPALRKADGHGLEQRYIDYHNSVIHKTVTN
jgi:hypothetical protein